MSAITLLLHHAEIGRLDVPRRRAVAVAAARLEALCTQAEVAAQRRYFAAVPCTARPVNGRETRAEREFIDRFRREEYAKRRPEAERLLAKLGRRLRLAAPIAPPRGVKALLGGAL